VPTTLQILAVARTLTAAALLMSASPIWAQDAFSPAPNQPRPGDIDAKLSRVYVHIGRLGWDHEHAAEGRLLAGNVQLGANERAGELFFDAASFIADTSDARRQFDLPGAIHDSIREKITQQIFSPIGLDADHFPQAAFRIQSARPTSAPHADGGGEYQFDGELTLHGVSRPLRIVGLVEPVNDMWRLRGEGNIRLADFGLHLPAKRLGKVTDVLSVEGDLWMRR
jgi:polyisoprenoid-binding protein YceI